MLWYTAEVELKRKITNVPNHYQIRVTIFPVKIDASGQWNNNDDIYY